MRRKAQTDRRAPVLLAVITLACLLPFVGRAFNIDDPMFLWTARHIQSHPFDFYGFQVNWFDCARPMYRVMLNPPVAAYYIAGAARIVGWSEVALHLAFLVPALAVVLGTYALARRFCSQPVIAALATLLTPVVLLSGTTVMCDTMMLAFWVWAIVFWIRGIDEGRRSSLLISAVLVVLCALTKYYGAVLILLLPGYALIRKRTVGLWALYALIPVAALAGYELATRSMYGSGLLSVATGEAHEARILAHHAAGNRLLTALSFTGGCVPIALLAAPLLWSRKAVVIGAVLACAGGAAIALTDGFGTLRLGQESGVGWDQIIQLTVMAAAGIAALALVVSDLLQKRDADAALLGAWVIGTFVFAGFLNWTTNGRSILPMAPAVGVLVVRRAEYWRSALGKPVRSLVWALVPAAFLALAVAGADYTLAGSAREMARSYMPSYRSPGHTLWFQGHWGFQFYAQQIGAKPIDVNKSPLAPGDLVVVPINNPRSSNLDPKRVSPADTVTIPVCGWLTAMMRTRGAGFYSSVWGPMPFVFGPVPEEKYDIWEIRATTHRGPQKPR